MAEPYPHHHPWFASTLKRKRRPDPPTEEEEVVDGAPRPKRQHALENRLASLSLNTTPDLPIPLHPPPTSVLVEHDESSMGQPMIYPDPLFSSDPKTESLDVQMKTTSWYEPEKDRIVVLDLDSDEDEGDVQRPAAEGEEDAAYRVSSALLARLKPVQSESLPKTDDNSSKALILFTPSPWTCNSPPPPSTNENDAHRVEDNTMDLDP